MIKKLLLTIICTIILTIIFIDIKIWIYGTQIEYIAGYMPSPHFSSDNKNPNDFPKLANEKTMIRILPFIIANTIICIIYTILLFKGNIYQNDKDIIYTCIVFIIPLVFCYINICNQFGYLS